jgi:hypothetical protein
MHRGLSKIGDAMAYPLKAANAGELRRDSSHPASDELLLGRRSLSSQDRCLILLH